MISLKTKTKMQKTKAKLDNTRRKEKSKKAFDETLEAYETMKHKSPMSIMDTTVETRGTNNPACPTPLDFICDVETQIELIVKDENLLTKLYNTYLFGGDNILSKSRQNYYEQRIGQLFIQRSIWPVSKYFKTLRNK